MRKLDEKTNVINWFDLPVTDMARARKFYETVLDVKMRTQYMEETDEELSFFPSVPGVIQATSGRVSGALVRNSRLKPGSEGVLVYLNAAPSIRAVIDRIEPAGGRVISPAKKMVAGYICVFIDSEGNRVGLHSDA